QSARLYEITRLRRPTPSLTSALVARFGEPLPTQFVWLGRITVDHHEPWRIPSGYTAESIDWTRDGLVQGVGAASYDGGALRILLPQDPDSDSLESAAVAQSEESRRRCHGTTFPDPPAPSIIETSIQHTCYGAYAPIATAAWSASGVGRCVALPGLGGF